MRDDAGMTIEELEWHISHIGCSGAQVARWLGVTVTTMSHWRTGKHRITGPAALAIQALSDGWRPR